MLPAPAGPVLIPPSRERHALVIGAGLAGAALCIALARRGWRITLVDAASGPARAASALPVGMLSPHVTRAPTPLSRLSALGVSDMRAELERLVPEGSGWQSCEVDNLGHDPGRWPAALVRPAAMVKAWLTEASQMTRLDTVWNASVARLVPTSGTDRTDWQALAADGSLLAQAPVVAVTAALGSLHLLTASPGLLSRDVLPLHPVQGQMSLAALDGEPLAPRPLRNNGVFVPEYRDSGLPPEWPERIWTMGSTYERGQTHTAISPEAHQSNATSLQSLCPTAAERLRGALARGELLGWAGVRCASQDRLPLMGAVPHLSALQAQMEQAGARRGRLALVDTPRWPGLYTLCALGSRGLTLSHWCATQLAAQMDGSPTEGPAAEQDLVRALDPARFAWKQARRQPARTFTPA